MLRVGWVGLGAMGAPMAACVARAGHPVTAYDIDAARAERLAADGVAPAAAATDAAAGAEVLVLMVATGDQAESVLFAEGGAADALASSATVVVMATVGPEPVRSWAERLDPRGIEVVDAPVSGGTARAATGDLVIMVAGHDEPVRRVGPVLEAMARTAPVVGPEPGDGQKVKLVNQMVAGVHIAIAAEALAFAEAMGLDSRATWEVLRQGAAASFMLDDRGARMVEGRFDDVHSALEIFVKDLGLVNGAARASGYAAPLAETAEQLYLAGRRAGLSRLDDSSVIEVLRRGLGWDPGATSS